MRVEQAARNPRGLEVAVLQAVEVGDGAVGVVGAQAEALAHADGEVGQRQARAGAEPGQQFGPQPGVVADGREDGADGGLLADRGARGVGVLGRRRELEPGRELLGELVALVVRRAREIVQDARALAGVPGVDEVGEELVGGGAHVASHCPFRPRSAANPRERRW